MCVSPKALLAISLTFLLSAAPVVVYAQPAPGDPFRETLEKLRSIEERIKQLERNQQETLARQEKILAELGKIRIWVRRQ